MKCTWCIQTNLNATESQKIQDACDACGQPYIGVKIIPFSDRVPRIVRLKEPFVLIGSTTLNANAVKSRKYKKGIFFNKNFNPQKYAKYYGKYYLNSDFKIFQLKDIPSYLYSLDTEIFIRSNDDSKMISGGTATFAELLKIKSNTESYYIGGDIFTPESEIFISSIKNIEEEFRFIIVDREVITGSQYRPQIIADPPDYVFDFVKDMAKLWLPHDVCVLDICEYNGLKVIECNCFNGSGFYGADHNQIVEAVSEYQIKKFNRQKFRIKYSS